MTSARSYFSVDAGLIEIRPPAGFGLSGYPDQYIVESGGRRAAPVLVASLLISLILCAHLQCLVVTTFMIVVTPLVIAVTPSQ